MNEKEKIIEVLKEFQQTDYKRGGVSIAPEMYEAISIKICKVLFDDRYTSSLVECSLCSHIWTAVRPIDVEQLECPNCGNICDFSVVAKGNSNKSV